MSDWHQINKEYVSAKGKEYYLKHRTRILAYSNKVGSVIIHCKVCDCMQRKSHTSINSKSKYHKDRSAFRALNVVSK